MKVYEFSIRAGKGKWTVRSWIDGVEGYSKQRSGDGCECCEKILYEQGEMEIGENRASELQSTFEVICQDILLNFMDFCVMHYNQLIFYALCSVNPTVSHNVGLFASICLASRLESDLDVFTLMIVAVALFTLLPSFRRHHQVSQGKFKL